MIQMAERTVPYEVYQREIERLEAENARLQSDLAWFTNSDLPIAARFAGYAVQKFMQERKPGDDGWYKAYLPVMGKAAGVSDSTISRGIEILGNATDALDKYTDDDRDENGRKRHSTLYFYPYDALANPAKVRPTKEINKHGGKRVKLPCPECGNVHRRRKTREECAECGHKFYENTHVYKACDEPLQVATDSGEQDSSETPIDDPDGSNLATLTPDMSVATCNGSLLPNTPPVSVDDATADLLLEIAGPGPAHIEMSTIPDGPKYFTVHHALTQQDMLDHLHGVTTKGIVGRSLESETRAICKDGDNPDEWQRCQEAARLLAIMGFKPLLIPSPVQDGDHKGGGHLWLIFDGLVDTYSAWQTVYQYTGGLLRDIKDYWPGGGINIRLPGGKYVMPDSSTWVRFYDEHGVELSRDGIDQAASLIDRQTPAELINAYPRPEPIQESVRTKPAAVQGEYLEKDLAKQVIADFNASHSWPEILGKSDRHGKYYASWRGDHNPNVAVYADTDLAYDHSTARWIDAPMDKYQVWCLLQGGQNWEAFKRDDLKRRCTQLREAQEPEPTPIQYEPSRLFEERPIARQSFSQNGLPTRMTICCNMPFQHGLDGPECSNPYCPEKPKVKVAS